MENKNIDNNQNEVVYNNSSEWCYHCRSKGIPGGCPKCGRDPHHLKTKDVSVKKVIMHESKRVLVPSAYLGEEWFKSDLIRTHKDLENDGKFLKFASSIEKLHEIFKSGRLPDKSALIIAPPQMSKVTFAYSCMQFAMTHGYKVAPLLDSLEVKRLLTLGAEQPNYHIYGKINYDEYLASDVVFVTITKTEYCIDAHHLILELLDRRSRMGLPTFFISRYDINTLSRSDKNGFFRYILDYNNTENSLKYPVVCSYQKFL